MVANKGGSAEYIKNPAKSNVANKEILFSHEDANDWVLVAVISHEIKPEKFRQDTLAYREFLKGYVKSEVDYFVTLKEKGY